MMKHLVSIDQYDKKSLYNLFKSIDSEKYGFKYQDFTTKKQIATLFYEPSTRTSASFHSAATQLGYAVLPINEVNYSSVTKGETLEDTIRTIASYVDLIVLRHGEKGAAQRAAAVSTVPIINAGDGIGEHPTQTLLDLYTIWNEKGTIDNLTITLMGDLKNGRTIHSLLHSLKDFNVKINLVSPDNLAAPFEYAHGVNISLSLILTKNICQQSDVLYITRVQKERGSVGNYELTKNNVKNFKKNMIVMHPFPRQNEIPTWFDVDPRAKYFKQIANGLLIRKSLLRSFLDDKPKN